MGSVLIIVWRESLEAVLVIGILYAYLARSRVPKAMAYLTAGVVAGVGLSALLAYASLKIQSELQGQALAYFQTSILFVAGALITQMVLWMDKHGRDMRARLEGSLGRALGARNLLGVAIVAALAVAREGSEMVMFVYGLGLEHGTHAVAHVLEGSAAGFAAALATAWVLSRGIRGLSYRRFFSVTGILLLVLAAGLFVSGVNRLIQMGVVSPIIQPVWNSSWLISNRSSTGQILASFTGYSATPSLAAVIAYAAYWVAVLGWRRFRERVHLGRPSEAGSH
ncbi:MAG: FTR1 family iron permease, partial [Acidiferrobacteraceae bacterium]